MQLLQNVPAWQKQHKDNSNECNSRSYHTSQNFNNHNWVGIVWTPWIQNPYSDGLSFVYSLILRLKNLQNQQFGCNSSGKVKSSDAFISQMPLYSYGFSRVTSHCVEQMGSWLTCWYLFSLLASSKKWCLLCVFPATKEIKWKK